MIKILGNQKIDITQNEWDYAQQLKEQFGEDCFNGLISTDKKGKIVSITPLLSEPTSLGILFFLLNLMYNQNLTERLEILETIYNEKLEKLEERLIVLENK